ncbi:hypothetical protein CLV70_105272 [Pseudosporangium ferrugineum]|uniref:Uncharacterized protein n=1 Tax=Pseudosporangium ferrugineum TaxID=439699 RepID=A0A2T0S9M2_9ACTN|nr:hypothetical protein CLV70_105272 [Pseudosporangium ferrugineum]
MVGVPALGALAAAESGVALDRLALVPHPGPEWATVVAALIDGVDVVVVAVPGPVSASVTSRLVARARQRGCVLVPYGRWDGADVTLQVTQGRWEGLGDGRGRLRQREVTVVARGRGAAARPKELTLWMPAIGPVAAAERELAGGGRGRRGAGNLGLAWPPGKDGGEGAGPARRLGEGGARAADDGARAGEKGARGEEGSWVGEGGAGGGSEGGDGGGWGRLSVVGSR